MTAQASNAISQQPAEGLGCAYVHSGTFLEDMNALPSATMELSPLS